ncbi:MAG: histidine phosphatase family protein [Rhizobiaceae bacterium]
MTQLYLLRHAKAEWAMPGTSDFDRPLKQRGKRNAEIIGSTMRQSGFVPDRVICSTAKRALETWEAASSALGAESWSVELTETLYGTDAAGYLRVVNEAYGAERLLLVGHNPMMEDVAFALAGGGDEDALRRLDHGFPTAGLAALEFDVPLTEIRPGQGTLLAFFAPSDA